ncbi:MAG: hypothetical protein ACJAZF_004573 [Granulosicoccus sp.]|jgi:hypothetical protein
MVVEVLNIRHTHKIYGIQIRNLMQAVLNRNTVLTISGLTHDTEDHRLFKELVPLRHTNTLN